MLLAAHVLKHMLGRFFSFLYLKKIKISKIYVRFGKFQKYTPVALGGVTGLKCNFFFFKFATKSLEKKKGGLSPTPGATGACRPLRGRQGPWGGRTWRVGVGMSAAPRPRLNSEEEKVGNFLADRGNKKTWVSLRIHGACHCIHTVRAFVR